MPDFHRTFVNDESLIRGPARLIYANATLPIPSQISQVINLSTYDATTGWNELGSTKGGIQITLNNAEENLDVDQIIADIYSAPTNWECSVSTQLADVTLERLALAWEGATVALVGSEKSSGAGQPVALTQRRLGVLFQKPSGKIRAFFFHKTQRTAQESTIAFNKAGEQQSIPVRFKALADASVVDVQKRFFVVFDQV